MSKIFSTIIFFVCFNLNAQIINSNYFTIGSTEKKVLQIQGEPTSVSKTGPFSSFSYGSSTVSFKNGLVDGYHNAGNLKVKMNINANSGKKVNQTTSKTNIPKSKKTVKVNNTVKYIYFTIISSEPSFDVDYSGNMKPTEFEYTSMYSISGYTFEKQQSLEFCLTKNYKEIRGRSATFLFNIFDDRSQILLSWNKEKGRLFRTTLPYYLMVDGVMEQ